MSLFEVQRLSEYWQGAQAFHEHVSVDSEEETREKRSIWYLPCHLFACSFNHAHGQWDLFVLDHVPVGGVKGSHEWSPEPLLSSTSPVVTMLALQTPPNTVLSVLADGCVCQFSYNHNTTSWKEGAEGRVRVEGVVNDAVLCQGKVAAQLVWSEKKIKEEEEEEEEGDEYTLSASTISLEDQMVVFDNRVLVTAAPPMCMYGVVCGVWLIPKPGTNAPPNLFFYWHIGSDHVIPYVYGSSHPVPHHLLSATLTSFRMLSLRTACVWSKVRESPCLLTAAVHSQTGQLITLSSDGSVHSHHYTHDTGLIQCDLLTTLKDFPMSYPSPAAWFTTTSSPPSPPPPPSSPPPSCSPLHLLTLHTYIGVFNRGEVRMYDSSSGEFVWECCDHEDSNMQLVRTHVRHVCPTDPLLCGPGGLFILRSKRIIDHAQFLADVLFPTDMTTSTPELENGHLMAAQLCRSWGMSLLASHYTLEAVRRLLAMEVSSDEQSSSAPPLSDHLPHLLHQLSVQNPILSVALLIKHPSLRRLMKEQLSSFLECCRDKNTGQLLLQTPLNADTLSLFNELLSLCNERDRVLHTASPPPRPLPSASACMHQLMDRSQLVSAETYYSAVQLRADIMAQCYSQPEHALSGVKQFIGVESSFSEAVQAVQSGKWTGPQVNWRSLLATERPEKQTTTTDSVAAPACPPLFEMVCQLLYQQAPNELPHFVTFAQLIHDYQPPQDLGTELGTREIEEFDYFRKCRKGYYQERAVMALSPPVPPCPSEQVSGYCHLLLLSDQPQSELKALTIILDHKMWEDAMSLLRQTLPQVSAAHQCALFHRTLLKMAAAHVLSTHLPTLWELLPANFSLISFLEVLKVITDDHTQGDTCTLLQAHTDSNVTVSDVTNPILELLARQCPV